MNLCQKVDGFFENDLSKQDRQTDKPLIDVEFALYDILGVHTDVLASWRSVHNLWPFSSNYHRGLQREMRLTGQATTSLGNVITNMQVHARFIH